MANHNLCLLSRRLISGIWIVPILLFSCHSHTRVREVVVDSAFDTTLSDRDKIFDTSKKLISLPHTDSAEGGEEELKGFFNDYIASYTRPCVIDSSFQLASSRFRILVKDSCLMDSAITIPKGYVEMYKLDSFVTHTFISKIRVEKDGLLVLERVVVVNDFKHLIDILLQRYATLRCPYLRLKGDSILLGYSISIPLTDLGSLEYVVIDARGNVSFRESLAGD